MNFAKIAKEMNLTIDKIIIFEDILNSLLIFLSVYLILLLVNLNGWYALLPALMYATISIYTTLDVDKAKIVEGRYNELHEKLRTAEDSIGAENPVVDELRAEVTKEMANVRVSSFLSMKKTAYKIVACVLLCFLIVFFASMNITLIDASLVAKLFNLKVLADIGIGNGTAVIGGTGAGGEDIYGNQSMAKLGAEQLQLNIAPVSYEVGMKEVSSFDQKQFEESFPNEVFAESSAAYEEKIALDDQELIKSYFKELSK